MSEPNLILPTLPEEIRVGFGRVHGVPDHIVKANLRDDLFEQCGARWYACIILQDGRGAFVPSHPSVPRPDEDHRAFLRDLAFGLNYRAAYVGHWVVAWVSDRKFVALWRDGDGDLHAVLEDDRNWSQMSGRAYGVDTYVTQGNMALQAWANQVNRVEAARWQQYRAALGERPPGAKN